MMMVMSTSALAIVVMMFVIVVMSASALIVVMMMLMIVVMSASALIVMVVMMMLMVVVMSASALIVMIVMMLMIVMSTTYRAELFIFFSALLHSFQNLCTVQFFDRSGDDHCILVHFADQSDCFCYFLFRSLRCIGTAQNNRSCIL